MKNDDFDGDNGIFHLSLTEIAFLIILALVLLLGFPLKKNIEELETLQNCRMMPTDPKVDADEPESLLLPCDRCVANRYKVTMEEAKRIQEVGMVVSSYLREKENITEKDFREVVKTIKSTEALKKELRALRAKEVAFQKASDELASLKKLNSTLKEEKEVLQNKLYYGGDFPPCMQGVTLRSNGTPYKWDNLFRIYMKENYVKVYFANDQVLSHPALDDDIKQMALELVNNSRANDGISWQAFDTAATAIFSWSERQIPRCRLAVVLENRIEGRKEADEKRMRYIETRFYKQEVLEKR